VEVRALSAIATTERWLKFTAVANRFGLQLVREGYAVVYEQYISGCAATADDYRQAESPPAAPAATFGASPTHPTLGLSPGVGRRRVLLPLRHRSLPQRQR
jgi:hypothetical protein